MAETVAQGERDMARQHHEHAGSGLAGFEQHLAIAKAAHFAETAHALDFVRRQRRECLLVAWKRERTSAGRRTGYCVCTHLATQKKSELCGEHAPGHPASSRT